MAVAPQQQQLRRKRISLAAPTQPVTETEKAFTDVLASISRAQQERIALKKEFEKHNTVRYCILEAGAETFELTRIYVMGIFSTLNVWRTFVTRLLPPLPKGLALAKVALPSASMGDDPRIAELKSELLRLREEMRSLTGTVLPSDSRPSASGTSGLTQAKPPVTSEDETAALARKRPAPLPFNADMLISAKKQQRTTPTKVSVGGTKSGLTKQKPRSPTMQEVLQRALAEKFKNVRSHDHDDLDTSFDNDFKQPVKDEERENAVKRPPIPPRPKVMRTPGAAPTQKKKAFGNQN